jgi:hypothetical protein
MSGEDIKGDEWDAYVTLQVRLRRTWDRLRDANPMATEAP